MASLLVERLHAVHDTLTAAGLRHAFGGAIALAYCTEEPRGTRDLDVNVFTDSSNARVAVAALPEAVARPQEKIDQILRDGQARLWWDDTPIDIFLNNHPYHEIVSRDIRWVPLSGREIPVLGCESLVVFKALFNRTKDWADIESVAAVDRTALTGAALRIEEMAGTGEESVARLRSLAG